MIDLRPAQLVENIGMGIELQNADRFLRPGTKRDQDTNCDTSLPEQFYDHVSPQSARHWHGVFDTVGLRRSSGTNYMDFIRRAIALSR